MAGSVDNAIKATLSSVAPGTELRDGLNRILRGRTGALVVLGWNRAVEQITTGGFDIDIAFTGTRLRELAKMDGAIVTDREGGRIIKAGVQLVPDPRIETSETGTRHRTAERVAKQTGLPVVSVSQSMQIIQVYVKESRHTIEGSEVVLTRANQALATLERYKAHLDKVTVRLSAAEIEDRATVGDVATVLQRLEMVRRISEEIETYIIELGTDGRLLTLQHEELVGGIGPASELLLRDYVESMPNRRRVADILADLTALSAAMLVDTTHVARTLGMTGGVDALEGKISPKGYSMLARVPKLPSAIADRLVESFGSLQRLLAATVADLQVVDGVGDTRARGVREALSRLAEASLVERYQ